MNKLFLHIAGVQEDKNSSTTCLQQEQVIENRHQGKEMAVYADGITASVVIGYP